VSRGELVSIERDGLDSARSALERCVARGGVAIFPADGLYGLCCDPLSELAVERIQALKGRDAGKPSAVMYLSPLPFRELISGLGPRVRDAAAALLPGPVTLVLPNPEHRYPLACREDPERVGVRLIEGPLTGMPLPVFQTSANPSGEPAAASFQRLDSGLLEAVNLAIDGGELSGRPSTVIDLTRLDADGSWVVLRQGAVGEDEVERVLS
jgi:L-threonylcarbamoyladenylate synthase